MSDHERETMSLFDWESEASGSRDDAAKRSASADANGAADDSGAAKRAGSDGADASETAGADGEKAPSFEEALAELDRVVKRMQSPECSLDEALTLFTRGTKLSAYCHRKLEEVEDRITVLTENAAGELNEEDTEI